MTRTTPKPLLFKSRHSAVLHLGQVGRAIHLSPEPFVGGDCLRTDSTLLVSLLQPHPTSFTPVVVLCCLCLPGVDVVKTQALGLCRDLVPCRLILSKSPLLTQWLEWGWWGAGFLRSSCLFGWASRISALLCDVLCLIPSRGRAQLVLEWGWVEDR